MKRDSKLTVRLTSEHRAIARGLRQLRAGAGKLEPDHLSSKVVLFSQLAEGLKKHFRKEEQLLFPLLGRSLGWGVCTKLKQEYAEIIDIAKKLSTQTGAGEDSFSYLEELFSAHISTEENVLFWYLDLQDSWQH
jgi:hemerythrin-like domain-containing protein